MERTKCDFTNNSLESESLIVVEVYEIGGLYPEENKYVTAVYIDKSIMPSFEEQLTIYTNEKNEFILLKDENKTWMKKDLDEEFVGDFKNIIDEIVYS